MASAVLLQGSAPGATTGNERGGAPDRAMTFHVLFSPFNYTDLGALGPEQRIAARGFDPASNPPSSSDPSWSASATPPQPKAKPDANTSSTTYSTGSTRATHHEHLDNDHPPNAAMGVRSWSVDRSHDNNVAAATEAQSWVFKYICSRETVRVFQVSAPSLKVPR